MLSSAQNAELTEKLFNVIKKQAVLPNFGALPVAFCAENHIFDKMKRHRPMRRCLLRFERNAQIILL